MCTHCRMPHHLRSIVEPYVLIGDIAVIGFFFIGGSVFFEKQERTLGAVVCSPLRFGEYLSVKLVALTVISLLVAVVVVDAVEVQPQHLLMCIRQRQQQLAHKQ